MTNKTGWFNKNKLGNSPKYESYRHSLASKGIKTNAPKGVKGFSSSGVSTPNFDMVKKQEYSMTLTDYHTILTRLGFHGKNTKVHKGKIHINFSGKWHLVENKTIKELGTLHNLINKLESKLGLTSKLGEETIISFGNAKVTAKGLKSVESLPFIRKGFAKKHKSDKVNLVFKNIIDAVPVIGKNLSRENAIMYQDMVLVKDALHRLKSWEVEKLKIGSYNMESPEYYTGIHKNVGVANTISENIMFRKKQKVIQSKINKLLYVGAKDKTDKEVLSIVLLGSKVKHFDFLTGKTRWDAIGDWQGFPNEKNVIMQVQFKDAKNEKYGIRLMKLLNEYNKFVVGEKLLYARTQEIEESTL